MYDGQHGQHEPNQKQTYYVNVQSGQLYEQHDIAPYHLVIEATPLERDAVLEQFLEVEDTDEWTLGLMFFQLKNDTEEMSIVNHEHDYRLQTLYRMLYELGNDETKRHIEAMRII